MKKIFKDYLFIFQLYPKEQYFTKKQRKQRYQLLQDYGQRTYTELPTIEEIQAFLEKYQEKLVVHPQFLEKLTSVLQEDITEGGSFALTFLLGDSEDTNYYMKYFRWAFESFGEYNELLNKLLERKPDYRPALAQKFNLDSVNNFV